MLPPPPSEGLCVKRRDDREAGCFPDSLHYLNPYDTVSEFGGRPEWKSKSEESKQADMGVNFREADRSNFYTEGGENQEMRGWKEVGVRVVLRRRPRGDRGDGIAYYSSSVVPWSAATFALQHQPSCIYHCFLALAVAPGCTCSPIGGRRGPFI
jgi:hypothetical protein